MDNCVTAKTLARDERTRVACRRCNLKKIKCNAEAGTPCRGCVVSRAECVLINSQRGRYVRRKAHAQPVPSQSPSPNENAVAQTLAQSFESRAPTDSNAMFYLHITDQVIHPAGRATSEPASTFYVGESFSLTYAIHDVLAPFVSDRATYQKRLYFPIAPGFDPSDSGRRNIVQRQTRLLRERNILHVLQPDALETLLDVYFCWFHLAFPLICQGDFLQKCIDNEMSLLVLNAVLLVAVTICDSADLHQTQCSSRQEARAVFYRQAKALYDADADPDKANNVMAIFLMSFWWGGSNDEKDSWHWLGIGVSLAQSLGMHRSTRRSHMSLDKMRHWKRIWWCLRIRDTLTSGSIGRPQHFSERDCDVEMLEPADLPDSTRADSPQRYYACEMAKLSIVFGRIITSRYSAVPDVSQKMLLEQSLEAFRSGVPKILQYEGSIGENGHGLWSAMLSMAYNFGVILLCRPPSSITAENETIVWGNRSKAMAAANETTRIMEDILYSSLGRLCQIHTIPALFNSLSMHVLSICTSGIIGRELAENRARSCMLGLTCLQESWPVSGWILKLFVEIMDRLKKKDLRVRNVNACVSPPSRSAMMPTPQEPAEQNPTPTRQDCGNGMEATGAFSTPEHGDGLWGDSNTAYVEPFPNLFSLDGLLSDAELEQMNFFDLLMVPNL